MKKILLSTVVVILLAIVLMPVINDSLYDLEKSNAYTPLVDDTSLPSSPVGNVSGSIVGDTINIAGVDYSTVGSNKCYVLADTFLLTKTGRLNYILDGTAQVVGFRESNNSDVTFTISNGVFTVSGVSGGQDVNLSIPYSWAYAADPNGEYLMILGSDYPSSAIISDIASVRSVTEFPNSFVSTVGDVATDTGGVAATVQITTSDVEGGKELSLPNSGGGIKVSLDGTERKPTAVLVERYVEVKEPTDLAKFSGLFYAAPILVIVALVASAAYSLRTRY